MLDKNPIIWALEVFRKGPLSMSEKHQALEILELALESVINYTQRINCTAIFDGKLYVGTDQGLFHVINDGKYELVKTTEENKNA